MLRLLAPASLIIESIYIFISRISVTLLLMLYKSLTVAKSDLNHINKLNVTLLIAFAYPYFFLHFASKLNNESDEKKNDFENIDSE